MVFPDFSMDTTNTQPTHLHKYNQALDKNIVHSNTNNIQLINIWEIVNKNVIIYNIYKIRLKMIILLVIALLKMKNGWK